VHIKAPIPQPKKNVICIGKNYKDHIAEVKAADAAKTLSGSTSTGVSDVPTLPVFFTKAPQCVIASGDGIESHENLS